MERERSLDPPPITPEIRFTKKRFQQPPHLRPPTKIRPAKALKTWGAFPFQPLNHKQGDRLDSVSGTGGVTAAEQIQYTSIRAANGHGLIHPWIHSRKRQENPAVQAATYPHARTKLK
jgi:hypothetical protein